MTDTHMHLVMLGKKLKSLALNDVNDINMMKEVISEFDSKDKWNVILGYDENNFPGQYKMKREEVDMLTHKPTLITRVCHHAGLINTAAMSLLGLDRTTEDPEGGYFERDADGELTGWVYDKAFEMVRGKLWKMISIQ
ncbi:amidohydrolase family protein [Salinicoccus siamensis]|uniref:amidohydrolase family protein n=1 Tax=Salinicoccus siamensis TaxID=381830 RepID=UPI00361A6B6A